MDNSSSCSSCRCCRSTVQPKSKLKNTEERVDCHFRRRRRPHCSLLHQQQFSTIFVTASITALLMLFPSATTTFSHAFRSIIPRRGLALVLKPIPLVCGTLNPDSKHTPNRYFSRDNTSRSLGVTSPRRDMATTTSLASTASPFFFTKPSSNDEVKTGQEVYTMESLCSYAEKLISRNKNNPNQNHQFCVYLAGGGSMSVSTLVATPGASSFLLEGRTTYDRHSYLNACEMPDRDTQGKGFSYGGEKAASLASSAALTQALKLTSMDDDLKRMPLTIGIGCASVLVSGEGSSSGKGTVVARAADGLAVTLTIEMKEPQRSRFEEELVLSHLVLRSAEQLMLYRDEENSSDTSSDTSIATDKEFITRAGDVITERWELPKTLSNEDTEASTIVTNDIDMVVEEAAKRVVDGGEDAVVLLPIYGDSASPIAMRSLSETVLPNRSLVFPGSFNPVHVGHLALANASIRTLEKHEPYIHPRRHNDKPIFFELSLTNVDKPSIDPKIVVSRVNKFMKLASSNDGQGDDSKSFPQQWGIVLTRAPLFEGKLEILRSKVLNRLEDDSPRINFVIGTDTMVRILNPKYYRNKARESMIESLLELKASGVGFIVGGRLEQGSASDPQFVSGKDDLVGLPEDVASMFTIMEESEFRVDLSSSQIRKQQEAAEQ